MIPNINKVLYQVDGYTDADRARQVVNDYAKVVAVNFGKWVMKYTLSNGLVYNHRFDYWISDVQSTDSKIHSWGELFLLYNKQQTPQL